LRASGTEFRAFRSRVETGSFNDRMGVPGGMPTWVMAVNMTAIRRYVGRNVPNDDIDDVVQEVMLRLHQRQAEKPIGNMRSYAVVVAHSVIIDRHRRNKVWYRQIHEQLEEIHHAGEELTPERVLMGREQMSRLSTALDDMPERHRDVFALHRYEDMSYNDIAEHLGISISSVGKDMMKAVNGGPISGQRGGGKAGQ
jgi:RNA polymerase sigma-70 factor (ECF subfamily)